DALALELGESRLPALQAVDDADPAAPERLLDAGQGTRFLGVLTGSLAEPQLIGTATEIARWKGPLGLVIERARAGTAARPVMLDTRIVQQSSGAQEQARLVTAQVGQALLVLLTMLLAGMVLSNLVEEKTNKIIEILAAAVPIDAIFLGKLFAMLAMAMIGIAAWTILALVGISLAGNGLPPLPAPATGWPLFMALGVGYFAMAYLLLGSLFLGIGAMATTVREVQTLSMPATMGQLLVFFVAAYSVTRMGEPVELFAVIFPFSSPFAMLARAAQVDALWPHLLALAWQFTWVLVLIRFGARLFRRNVLKSGAGKKRGLIAGLFARP
uniref:ABC transporter permease n=1 Tax=Blastomonas sp. TaxID=1909299 RepID=UPI0035942598